MGIENKVLSLVRKFGTSNPYKIAKELDINLLEANLGEVKGYYTKIRRIKFIFINENLSKNEKIFTMAHELKHAIDHADLIGYYSLCYGGKGKLELEANKFATELMLLLYQEQYQEIPETFDKLILTYGVKEEMREYY